MYPRPHGIVDMSHGVIAFGCFSHCCWQAACAAADAVPTSAASPWLMPENELDALLHTFQDRFPEAVPDGLPPERNIGSTFV